MNGPIRTKKGSVSFMGVLRDIAEKAGFYSYFGNKSHVLLLL